jgi:required for meiotic nuclear division protein 1
MYRLTAINVSDKLDVRQSRPRIPGQVIIQTMSEVFIKTDDTHFVTLFNNGIAVFVNFEEAEQYRILHNISQFMVGPQLEHLKETLVVDTTEEDRVYYEAETLMVPDDLNENNLLRLVMYDLAQSVAIDHYSNLAELLHAEVEGFAEELERRGKISLTKSEMMKFIGKSLSTKNKIVKNLYLYDNPDIVWEEGDLEKVHKVLVRTYDLGARIKEIQSTFDVIDDNLDKFQGMYQHGHSAKLEWIVIILILIEILKSIGESIGLF